MAEDTSKTSPAKATPAKADPAPAPVPADQPVVVTDAPSAPFDTKPSDVPVDPRSGRPFEDGLKGLKGPSGFEVVDSPGNVVQGVDPDRIPAEVTPGVSPDAGGDKLLAAAQAKAPNLTAEFVSKMGITDEMLGQIARGEISPPPAIGPNYTADLHLTPGGWQQTPPGVPPEDVGKNAIGHR
ncbi:MAG TPA: hypothetical protein VHK64_08620 [Nocardioidaceae bacterium]|jgi:hypothetical protein|nr:hypothetical protein [Nocardioidaceae bacterium]